MLKNVEVFSDHSKELEIWLKEALSEEGLSIETSHQSRIVFLARCLASLINNPTPYVDRMLEIVSDSGGSNLQDDVDMETVSVGTSESAIDGEWLCGFLVWMYLLVFLHKGSFINSLHYF